MNEHIATETILQDRADTLSEIERMEIEIVAFELLGDRMSMFRADGRRSGIAKRKEFIRKLDDLLKSREVPSELRP